MSKCIVKDCKYYAGSNHKCSIHSSSKKLYLVKNLLKEYIDNNLENIVSNSQGKNLLTILKYNNRDDEVYDNKIDKLNDIFSNFMILYRKKTITADLAFSILNILYEGNLKDSHLLVHQVYPYVIDVWNIDDKHFWPAVCYYQSHDIDYNRLSSYFNMLVFKDKFIIPTVPPRFRKY